MSTLKTSIRYNWKYIKEAKLPTFTRSQILERGTIRPLHRSRRILQNPHNSILEIRLFLYNNLIPPRRLDLENLVPLTKRSLHSILTSPMFPAPPLRRTSGAILPSTPRFQAPQFSCGRGDGGRTNRLG